MPSLMVCWQYYPLRKGEITEIILAGFVLSPAVFAFLAFFIVNPCKLYWKGLCDILFDNYSPTIKAYMPLVYLQDCVTQRSSLVLRDLSVLYVFILTISLVLIRPVDER